MANKIRSSLALAVFMLACGDDDGGGDGEALTLDDALMISGTDTSDERADLLFPAACAEQVKCKPEPDCAKDSQAAYDAMKSGRSAACLDATLDLYSCFVTTPCAEYDEDDECNALGEKQAEVCNP